jgi:hemerythrin-like domain-containing protein
VPIIIGAKRESNFGDPIGLLGDCHRRIERFLGVLIRVADQAHGGSLTEEQRASWETALRYFREAAPKHTADEEESLFPRLRKIDRPDLQALLARVDALQEEHACAEKGHAEVDRLGQLRLSDCKLPSEQAARLITVLAELGQLYRHHIAMEDAEVFPIAAEALSASDRAAVGNEMASRRGLKVPI